MVKFESQKMYDQIGSIFDLIGNFEKLFNANRKLYDYKLKRFGLNIVILFSVEKLVLK